MTTDLQQTVTEIPVASQPSQTLQDRHLSLAQEWDVLVSAHGLDYAPARALQTEMREIRRQLNDEAAIELDILAGRIPMPKHRARMGITRTLNREMDADEVTPESEPKPKTRKGKRSTTLPKPISNTPLHEHTEEIVAAYRAGATPYRIGIDYGLSNRRILRILTDAGEQIRPPAKGLDYDTLVAKVRAAFPDTVPSAPTIKRLLGVSDYAAENVGERL
ncbi:MAG TPA: hypothetical protein VN519_06545 [Bryobacteraceae bacterium]|nr:hypothetical protein [Bryobacteraceae bacterium]